MDDPDHPLQMRILVAVEAVDGRKGIDSLARLCREKLQADPFSGCLIFFRSRSRTSIGGFWSMTARGVLVGAEAVVRRAVCLVAEAGRPSRRIPCWRIRHSYCWRPAIRIRKPRQCGTKSVKTKHLLSSAFFSGMLLLCRKRGATARTGDRQRADCVLAGVHSGPSRQQPVEVVASTLCEALGWKQPNGALRDVVCRGLLLIAGAGRPDPVAARCVATSAGRTARSDHARQPSRSSTTPLAMPLESVGPGRRCNSCGERPTSRFCIV